MVTKRETALTNFIKKIKECKSLKKLDDLAEAIDKVYKKEGGLVPDELLAIGEAKAKELEKKIAKPKVNSADPSEWRVVTMEEKDKAEADGKLAGWNQRTMEALINK